MKSEKFTVAFGILALAAPFASGANEPAAAPARPERHAPATPEERAGRGNIAAALYMHRLLSMNDEQLARSRQVIEKVEKLSPDERAVLRKRLEGLRDAPPAEREKIAAEMREKFGISGEEFRPKQPSGGKPGEHALGKEPKEGDRRGATRNLLEKHWASLPPDQAKVEREKFLAMTREEKVAYLRALREKHGLPPEPEHKDGERRRPRPPEGDPATPPPPPPPGDAFGK